MAPFLRSRNHSTSYSKNKVVRFVTTILTHFMTFSDISEQFWHGYGSLLRVSGHFCQKCQKWRKITTFPSFQIHPFGPKYTLLVHPYSRTVVHQSSRTVVHPSTSPENPNVCMRHHARALSMPVYTHGGYTVSVHAATGVPYMPLPGCPYPEMCSPG